MSVNLGRVAYVEKGAYDGGTTYQKKDVVSYNNGSYVYIADVSAAGIVPTDTAYWQPMMNPEAMNRAAEAANKAAEAATAAVPNLRKELDGKAPAILVDASGDMVHITDGAEGMPVQSLVTHIAPVQSGSGDPSPDNVRPISGWDRVSVTRAGKNFLNPAYFMNTTEADGVYTFSRTGYYANLYTAQNGAAHVIAASDFYKLPVLDAGEYVLTQKVTSGGYFSLYAVATDGTKSELATEVLDTGTPRKTKYTVKARTMVCLIRTSNGNPTVFSEMILEKSSTATGFEPYNGETLTAELPETVYGGTLDWTTGVLTVDVALMTLTGDENWLDDFANSGFYHLRIPNFSGKANGLYSHYPIDAVSMKYFPRFYVVSAFPTLQQWKEYLTEQHTLGTPLQITYYIIEPYTIQLTPQQLSTLKGVNNIWSDAGETEVTYAADTKLYADGKDGTAMIGTAEPGMVATKNYASGDFVVVGKSLYKATAAIATGEAITPGINCTATTVIEQLAAIYNLIK